MSEFSPEEVEQRKKAVFDAMSPRLQKHILKKGYQKWDPFQEPKDPIEIRRDKTHDPDADPGIPPVPFPRKLQQCLWKRGTGNRHGNYQRG